MNVQIKEAETDQRLHSPVSVGEFLQKRTAARMYLRSLLFACLLVGCFGMDCDNQRALYATCSMMSENGLKGTIDLSQPATACFGPRDPMEMLVSMEGFKADDSSTQHAIIVKDNGDLSNGCQATGPIFMTPGDRSPTGFLANYDTGNRQAFKVQSRARLNGPTSIIGRTLAMYQGPYPNNNGALEAIGCCVIGHSDGSRFAGMPKPQVHRHDPFSFPSTAVHPPKSSSFLAMRHGFNSHPSSSLPFSHRQEPRGSHSDFGFDLQSLGNIGSHTFGGRHFGMNFGGNAATSSGLSPSISNLKKPPAPPAFPGGIHNTDTGSPLFGPIGDDSNSVKNTFGIDLRDFTQLSDSDKYIPSDGEETEAPAESGQYEEPEQRPRHQPEYVEQPNEDERYNDQNPHSGANPGSDVQVQTPDSAEQAANPQAQATATAPAAEVKEQSDSVPSQAVGTNSDPVSTVKQENDEANVTPIEHEPAVSSKPNYLPTPDPHHQDVDAHDIHDHDNAHLDNLLHHDHNSNIKPVPTVAVHPTVPPSKAANIVHDAIQKAVKAKSASTNVQSSEPENTAGESVQSAASNTPSVSDAVAATATDTPTSTNQNQPSSTDTSNKGQDSVGVKQTIDSATTEDKVQTVHPNVQVHPPPSLNFQPLPYDHTNHVGHFPAPVNPLPPPGLLPVHPGNLHDNDFGGHLNFQPGQYGADDSSLHAYGPSVHTTV